jgi:hypothetical protein
MDEREQKPRYPVGPGAVNVPAVAKANADPWAHRSTRMTCETCMWFVPKKTEHGSGELGRCRRHAPTLGGWPAVFTHDWCGDHKLDEARA